MCRSRSRPGGSGREEATLAPYTTPVKERQLKPTVRRAHVGIEEIEEAGTAPWKSRDRWHRWRWWKENQR